ncbi:hypothetical protein V6N13_122215 [Hibiscus sabdariffa]|uniref:Beta-galactosidase galactose-binding domain-containing protein n=1 Tax=Hibiscus sabdariffa TaxID=183260 RepID=A0ABR2AL55_9ROSI
MERWEEYNEPISTISNTSLRAKVLLDHMSTTKDISDYLWYTVRIREHILRTWFDAPGGNDPLASNLGSMGKGEVWVNGESIG